jgi:hypothetical protein
LKRGIKITSIEKVLSPKRSMIFSNIILFYESVFILQSKDIRKKDTIKNIFYSQKEGYFEMRIINELFFILKKRDTVFKNENKTYIIFYS